MPLARKTLRYLLFLGLLATSVSCDQGTKTWARRTLSSHDVSVIPGFWDFRLTQNPAGAFNLLRDVPGGRWVLTVIGVLMVIALFVWLSRQRDGRLLPSAALGLVAGGAIGNLWDRVVHGSVTDFIYWHWHQRPWPIFNVADAVLLVGVGLLLLFGAPTRREPAAAT